MWRISPKTRVRHDLSLTWHEQCGDAESTRAGTELVANQPRDEESDTACLSLDTKIQTADATHVDTLRSCLCHTVHPPCYPSLQPLAENTPKATLPIGNVPMVAYAVQHLMRAGFDGETQPVLLFLSLLSLSLLLSLSTLSLSVSCYPCAISLFLSLFHSHSHTFSCHTHPLIQKPDVIIIAQQTASSTIQHQLKEVLRLGINIHIQTVDDDRFVSGFGNTP